MLDVVYYPTPAWKSYEICDATADVSSDVSSLGRHTARAGRVPDSKGCILIVDDDTSIRETLGEILEDEGFRVLLAADATQALVILRQHEAIDVLVTDLTMPGEDGIVLIRRARAIRNGLPAVLLTGYAEQVTSVTAVGGGNFHVLRKPVESDRLIQELELLVARPSI